MLVITGLKKCADTGMFIRIVVLVTMLGLVSGFHQYMYHEPESSVGKVARLLPEALRQCIPEATCLVFGETPPTALCRFYILRCTLGKVLSLDGCFFDVSADFSANLLEYGLNLEDHDRNQYIADVSSTCAGGSEVLDYIITFVKTVYEEVEKRRGN